MAYRPTSASSRTTTWPSADFEQNLEPICREAGPGVIPYYLLASGFLTGKYRSEADVAGSARGRGVKKYLLANRTRTAISLAD